MKTLRLLLGFNAILSLMACANGVSAPTSRVSSPTPQVSPEAHEGSFTSEPGQGKGLQREQTSFGMEDKIERPVTIPEEVLDQLKRDHYVQERCRAKLPSVERIPPSWFAASGIHLHDQTVSDLVIQPSEDDPCIGGANVTRYWVFHNTANGYELVLTDSSFGLDLLKARTNGFRDIRMTAFSPRSGELGTIYRFDGKKYRAVHNYRRPARG
jgi:hypothetical protein